MSRHPVDLAIPVSAVDHALGAEHSPVTVVEYGDFECPTCKQAAPAVKVMLERFGSRVRFVFRHFPVESAHPHAMHAAQAAEAAGGQRKFWQMHDLLFENQRHLKIANLREYAQRLDLDMPRFIAEIDDEIYLQRVREHIQGGLQSHVRGTPTFYINGVIQDVSFGMHALIDGVQAEIKRVER
jgi:protein-disulfide isomerase